MAHNIDAQQHSDPAGFPGAASHAFSPYMLSFDEFAEPRTIPTQWDLSGLLFPDEQANGAGPRQPGQSPATDIAGR